MTEKYEHPLMMDYECWNSPDGTITIRRAMNG